jgi:hypothetical protein
MLFALAGSAFAQTTASSPPLAPELTPLAVRHKADLATVDRQRAAALAPYVPFYVAALDKEEKSALNRGDIEAVAAIRKEREAVKGSTIADLLGAPFPEKLPSSLKPTRGEFLQRYKSVDTEMLTLRHKADADYLRALDALQPRAAGNAELTRQIKAESDAVLGNPVTKPDGEIEVATKTGKLINGDFSQADANGFPVGWKLLFRGLENPPPKSETYKVGQENNRSFLHTAFEEPNKGFEVSQVVDVPRFAKEAELTLHIRGNVSDAKKHRIVFLETLDASGKHVGEPNVEPVVDSGWKTYNLKAALDGGKTIKQVRIKLEGHQFMHGVTGYVDFSRVELHFK